MSNELDSYIPVCDAVAALLQPHAEVVLHDLLTQSIHYIANSYSKRRVGDSSLNDIGADFDASGTVLGPYPKTNWDGHRLKSVTAVLRSRRGKPVGLLCINYDIEAVSGALENLTRLIALPAPAEPPAALLSKDWREAANTIVGQFLKQRRAALSGLTNEDLDALLKELDERGIFQIRRAVPYVAELLKLSRATIYNRLGPLRAIRNEDAG